MSAAAPAGQHHHQPAAGGALSIPKTSRIGTMEQTGDFTYEEGDRKARATKATLDAEQNLILLETAGAHVGRHRLHRRRPHPPGPAHRRFHRRGQRQLQPPAR